MEKNLLIVSLALLYLAGTAAAEYVGLLRELDQRLICVVVWFAPAVIALFIVGGGLLIATGSPANRIIGKNMIQNAVIGLMLVMVFLFLSVLLVPEISLDLCW